MVDLISLCNSSQFNDVRNVNDRSLGLVMSNLDPKRDAHHLAITMSLSLSPLKFLNEERPAKPNFYWADCVKLNDDLLSIDCIK